MRMAKAEPGGKHILDYVRFRANRLGVIMNRPDVYIYHLSPMPPRLNKRQQRELEELESLGASPALDNYQEEASSEEETPAPAKKASAFSNFLATQEIDDDNEDNDDEEDGSVKPSSKSRKKKKKKKGTASAAEPATPAVSTPPPEAAVTKEAPATASAPVASKAERKAAKKARAKEKKTGGDEIEQALAELSVKYPSLQKSTTSSSTSASSNTLASLLSVSTAHLDPESEMRKFFGSKVIAASKSPGSGGSTSAGAARRAGAAQRSNLTKPQPTWWSASQREGLSIRSLTSEEVEEKQRRHGWDEAGSGEKWWTVEYSQRYKSMTKGFIAAVMSGHPEALWEVQRRLPWHADNLLQLAEIYRHREEHAQAVDFVDRAIFTYERAFIGAFNFTSGTNRLDFDRVENRPFYLAVHRQVSDLQRRGCVRTAFEFAKLLYSMDPWVDPHGAIHHLEILGLKSGNSRWLLDLWDYFAKRPQEDDRLNPTILPGFMYARALGMKILEDAKGDDEHEKSTAALKDAVRSYPSVVPLLADKIDVTLPASVAGHPDFRIETDARSLSESVGALHLLSHMYALRSGGIWKESDHSKWFSSTIQSLSLPSPLPVTPQKRALLSLLERNENIRSSIYRHVVVLESTHKRLFSFIPSPILSQAKSSLACDPLPPPSSTCISSYDPHYFAQVPDLPTLQPRGTRGQRRQQAALDARMLAQILPNADARRQLEEMIEGNEELREQFPGGLREVFERLGVEGLEDVMLAGAAGVGLGGVAGRGGGGGVAAMGVPGDEMPGGFEGDMREGGDAFDEDRGGDGNEDEEDDEDDEEVSLLPRILRNFVGRLWGGPAPADESTDEDEDDEDNVSEHGGVD